MRHAPPEPATTSASTAITSETGPYSHHSGALPQVKPASVSTRKAAAGEEPNHPVGYKRLLPQPDPRQNDQHRGD